jgi:DNA-binding Lrp family transcriptional regulator
VEIHTMQVFNPLRSSLDNIDLMILRELQADGRMTNVELSRRVGISPPPCLRRLRTLEERGFIEGYRARLNGKLLGYDLVCFAMVLLERQSETELKRFVDAILTWKNVRECWAISGDIDFLLRCVTPDLAQFQIFVRELTALPNVKSVRTSLAIEQVKDEPGLPLE